jgi:hypothetical protein
MATRRSNYSIGDIVYLKKAKPAWYSGYSYSGNHERIIATTEPLRITHIDAIGVYGSSYQVARTVEEKSWQVSFQWDEVTDSPNIFKTAKSAKPKG